MGHVAVRPVHQYVVLGRAILPADRRQVRPEHPDVGVRGQDAHPRAVRAPQQFRRAIVLGNSVSHRRFRRSQQRAQITAFNSFVVTTQRQRFYTSPLFFFQFSFFSSILSTFH